MEKQYNIIYADPPWQYNQRGLSGSAEKHYPTLNVKELCSLSVQSISAPDCILFLWATFPMLQEALQVISAWGFTYKTVAFVWVKQNKVSPTWYWGMGFWTRSNVEICLLATKGHPQRKARNIHQLVITPVEHHSKKPDIVYNKIEELMGDLPRIELFARQKKAGWDTWGNEIEKDIEL